MERIAAIVRKEVHAALLLDMEDQRAWEETFSAPHVRDGLRRLADEARDEDRIVPTIVTVQGKSSDEDYANGLYRQCTRCFLLREITISRANPEIAAMLDALGPFLKRCQCKE